MIIEISILIPTYNRSKFLIKNLERLSNYLKKGSLSENVEIVISNNSSNDNTHDILEDYIKKNPDILIQYFLQSENIGLEKNALFVLEKAKGLYVMYLGDDDYIEFDYLLNVYNNLTRNYKIFSIVPNYVPIDLNENILGESRDCNIETKLFKKGFINCVSNSWRAHQLSGLVLKREDLLYQYINCCVKNIYPFIFLLGYSCLRGDTLHITEFPVKVTQPGQQNKDWGYGKDGLFNEIFDNYKKLPINYFQCSFIQLYHFIKQDWRIFMYKSKGFKPFLSAFINIMFSKNSTFIFKIVFPFLIFLIMIRLKIKTTIS